MKITEDAWGYWIHIKGLQILFGGQKASFTNLQQSFPQIEFSRVKQTHGDNIVEVQTELIEADAHWTQGSQALCISTADCSPVMIWDPTRKIVASIHAGWRGVANRIVPKTLQLLKKQGSRPENLQIFIGPHIQMNSFEVEKDVHDTLLASMDMLPEELEQNQKLFSRQKDEKKILVDLNKILKFQIASEEIPAENLFCLHIDTFTDLRFHSHRRDKEGAGRQMSFIRQEI